MECLDFNLQQILSYFLGHLERYFRRPYVLLVMFSFFSFFLFRREISEVARPIAVKLCHVITICVKIIILV